VTYYLGVDLGTTYTAAGVWREHKVEIANLGNRAPVIPSLILLREDEEILTGEAADRRGASEPERLAREFKRRLGDPAPIIIGGTPYSAASLMGRLLRWVVDKVSESEGGPPLSVAVSHPANWGPYKTDLLTQAIQVADLDDVTTLTEPEAAAIHYATQSRVADGSVIGVYDLGGGTFDAAVLRKVGEGFEILGEPQGIERLGGVDFDEAVYQFVLRSVGDAVTALDPEDPTAVASMNRLRAECVAAKEALSADTDATIPVILPGFQKDVRITREEFEHLVRPSLTDSITSVSRALRSAEIEPGDLTTVLLVGGSSRIPLVGQMVGTALGRPVAVDAHPKHGIALGAAIIAAQRNGAVDHATIVDASAEASTAPVAPPPPDAPQPTVPPATPTSPAVVAAAALAAAAAADSGAGTAEPTVATPAAPTEPKSAAAPPAAPPPAATPPATPSDEPAPAAPAPVTDATGGPPQFPSPGAERPLHAPEPAPLPAEEPPGKKPPVGLLVGIGAAILLVVVGAFVLFGGGDDEPTVASQESSSTTDDPTTTTSDPGTTSSTIALPTGPFVTLDSVANEGGVFRVNYEVLNFQPLIGGDADSKHLHLFLDTTEPANAGNNGNPPGVWEITDDPTTHLMKVGPADAAGATQVCAVVATVDHDVFDPDSGTCLDLPA